ncbi:ABC transporter%2C phosphonate%2C periplasmic substrate-binding protein [Salmonella enterica subsp. enterica serovar Typhi]|nr:ABC transporter%2C phosphonate%2C periplasmic substrate-binding protein [Salmonella enterica subsp. enterica serovar Typhi]
MLYCNGTDKLATPSGLDAITKIAGAKVAVLGPGSPAGYKAMGADQAQIGFLPSLQLWQASDRYGAKVVLQTERNGAITYPAQFMTNNPSK